MIPSQNRERGRWLRAIHAGCLAGQALVVITLLVLISLRSAAFAQGSSASEQASIARGIQLLREGQAAQAKVSFDAALKAAPQAADALTWRGICENQLAQYSAAVTDFRSALRIDPTAVPAHYNLALSLIRLHETDAAIEQLRVVVAAQPKVVQPRYNIAILLEGKGLYSEAVQELQAAHALAPSDHDVTLHLLLDELKVKDPGAVLIAKEVADPSTPIPLQREAGEALIEAGRFTDATSILETSRAREPDALAGEVLLARAYIGDRNNTAAIELLKSIPVDERDEEAIYLLAEAYEGTGDLARAVGAFEAAARADPKDARPLYRLGLLAAVTSGGETKSVQLLRSATQLAPANTVYALSLARILLVSDQAEEAKLLLSKMPSNGEDAAQLHTLAGVADAATHDIDHAIPQLRTAIREEPKLALAHNVLGFCLFQQGHYAEAAAAYGAASDLEPQRLLYAHDAALAYERANQMQQALIFAERANTLVDTDAGNHVLLGKLYALAGRRQEALHELRRAVELNPDLDSAYYLLARTYMQMGDRQQATEWSERLSTLKQRHDAALTLQKQSSATPIRSSTLLTGGSLQSNDAGAP